MRSLVYTGVLLIIKLSSKFTFDYKYIINGFQIHNESCARASATKDFCELRTAENFANSRVFYTFAQVFESVVL